MNEGMLLKVSEMTKVFQSQTGRITALEEVSFSVRQGEFVCLVGPSGCGKSTLLSLIAGLERPTSGEILLSGERVTGPGVERAMVFQKDCLFPWLSVADNVRFGLNLRANRNGLSAPRMQGLLDRCDHLLEVVGLSRFRDAYPKELSGGMRQRVALARALVNQPKVLLMDEPFGALDAQTREEMQELLLKVCERQGTTVLFVTHDVEEAVFLADRILVMQAHPGKIVGEVPVSLPRPRSLDMTLEASFQAIRGEVLKLLYHRRRRTLSEELLHKIV